MTKKPQLFMIHFAGGNCYSFKFLNTLLVDFDIVPLELPGRGKRMREKLLTNFDTAAEDIYRLIAQQLRTSSFMIYGHSLGASLGLKVCGMLNQLNLTPLQLIVSGNPGPGVRDLRNLHQLGHDDFLKELRSLGGAPEELISNKELFDFFEPILRADFEIASTSGATLYPKVDCPIYAMMGDQEEGCRNISNWERFTSRQFSHEVLKGNHFFIYEHAKRIATIIKNSYAKGTILPHQ